jgi:hypothetical protein
MDESAQANLFYTIKAVINGVIEDKKENDKMREKLEKFDAKINIGLHTEDDFILWVNLVADNGNFQIERGKLEEYDLELIADPEDLMYFTNGTYSTLHMLFKKNRFGNRKLQINKGSTGWNLGLLLKLPKLLVLD